MDLIQQGATLTRCLGAVAAVSPLEDLGPWDQREIQFRHTPDYCSGDKNILTTAQKTKTAHIVLLADKNMVNQ